MNKKWFLLTALMLGISINSYGEPEESPEATGTESGQFDTKRGYTMLGAAAQADLSHGSKSLKLPETITFFERQFGELSPRKLDGVIIGIDGSNLPFIKLRFQEKTINEIYFTDTEDNPDYLGALSFLNLLSNGRLISFVYSFHSPDLCLELGQGESSIKVSGYSLSSGWHTRTQNECDFNEE